MTRNLQKIVTKDESFLPKGRLNEIIFSLVLNLYLFNFFLCFLTFLLKCSIISQDSVPPVLILKRKTMCIYFCRNYLENQGISATEFATSRTVIPSIVTLNESKCTLFTYIYSFKLKLIYYRGDAAINMASLNKTVVNSFPKYACLATKWSEYSNFINI